MIAPKQPRLMRVSMTLDPVDVDLLDRLGRLEGKNRSAELRGILAEVRPMLAATVEAFEKALAQRDEFQRLAATGLISDLEAAMPEVERLQEVYLGAISRLEGAAAAAAADADPRASNHGGHNLTPPPDFPPSDEVPE